MNKATKILSILGLVALTQGKVLKQHLAQSMGGGSGTPPVAGGLVCDCELPVSTLPVNG